MIAKTSTGVSSRSSGARNAPFIDLQDALGRARILYEKAKRSTVHLSVVAGYWGYSPKASNFTLVVSALKKYGLAVDEGSSSGRRIRLSELGHQILADSRENSPDREARVRQAALLPKAHRELWEEFGPNFPDGGALEVFLKLERGYSEDAARNAVKVYRATILFAALSEADTLGDVAADSTETDSSVPEQPDGARPATEHQNVDSGWRRHEVNSSTRTYSIPLKRDRKFDMRFPADLTEDDFETIVRIMTSFKPLIAVPDEAARETK
jgi:hypothetical protein